MSGHDAAAGPLSSVRVLDLSRYAVGAITTRRLADLGADVVKVESPRGGDPNRRLPPHARGAALWHELENAGKRSLTVDRSLPEDRDLLGRLATAADVVVANGARESLSAFGLRDDELRKTRPDIVICFISAFGTGELADQPAHGMNLDSLAGIASVTADQDGADQFVHGAYGGWSNEVAAHHAALAITAGVLGARAGQGGTVVDVSCYDAAVEANRMELVFRLAAGSGLQETLGPAIWSARHRLYRTADDRLVYFSAVEQGSWQRFCDAVERPDLAAAAAAGDQIEYGSEELARTLAELFGSRTSEHWSQLFLRHRIPANCVLDVAEVGESAHFESRGLASTPNAAGVPRIASPITFDSVRRTSAPDAPGLGVHRDEVVAEWTAGNDAAPEQTPS